ncbi:MAG: hypothetical protein KatS3mg115_1932 [Candidatus Poribacteria bacterium]|nr:MAG: hypothetical protein KatS3mg115_1932 [Candidatus Poribacteria bacterium]
MGKERRPEERVELYWRKWCPFSLRALYHLWRHRVPYKSICITGRYELRDEIERRCGRRDVPQLFVDGNYVGDDDAIWEWAATGKLDALAREIRAQLAQQSREDRTATR